MKYKLFSIFLLASLILTLIGPGTVFAQTEQPPAQPWQPAPHRSIVPPVGQGTKLTEQGSKFSIQRTQTGSQIQPEAQASLTLGQPGTSFRYLQTFGRTENPYLSDTTHINRPLGLFMDGSNNLYVVEEQGNRLLEYDSAGTNTLEIGKAGVSYTDDYVFSSLKDTTLDSGGNIWVADGNRVVQYTAGGDILQSLPAQDDNPWESGNTNTRFDNAYGIAFDSSGKMYVSDMNNHRVQVYDMTGGSPVYNTTIGTGSAGSGSNQFDSPHRIVIDSSDRLYVTDSANNRVQRCTFSGSWTCVTFDSGLDYPEGITVDSSNNVYIADTRNARIRKCTSAGVCSDLFTGVNWFYDVAVDSSGNIYGTAAYEDIVIKFNSTGSQIDTFLGVEFVPYLTDGYHYNHPRIAIDNSNNMIVLEENGQRLLKLDPTGTFLWSVGVPGVDSNDDTHFSYPHGVATDKNGNIYVADGSQVKIFTGGGVYSTAFGSYGTGDYQFGWATGIAVDKNGNIYVADYDNNRIQIYNSSHVFIGRIGVTGGCSAANDRFCEPIAVAVDSAGNIYVTDAGNTRVQKFNSSRQWQMTIGGVGWGNQFDEFNWAEDVAVDAQGKIYVTDWSNNRVQVFDSAGSYLATIGGEWGSNSSQFRGVPGVDVDSSGNVYVTDWENARIQKYANYTPDWKQTNINGFGSLNNDGILTLGTFDGSLYAGTSNSTSGAQIWRSLDGKGWTSVMVGGFGDINNIGIDHLLGFDGNLYAGTENYDSMNNTTGGELWRSSNGTTWDQVTLTGFDTAKNAEIYRLAIYNNQLYASTWADGGLEIWRSSTGDSGSWSQTETNGFGDTNNNGALSFESFGGYLYAGTLNAATGGEIWRSASGDAASWSQVNTDGFGTSANTGISALASFGGWLYAATKHDPGSGVQVWRCQVCDGTDWVQVIDNGLGSPSLRRNPSLEVFANQLYLVAGSEIPDADGEGMSVWRSSTGDSGDWDQVASGGFGTINNWTTYWDNAAVVFGTSLYLGTLNWQNGGQIWRSNFPVAINVEIGGVNQGNYDITPGGSTRANYSANNGPVKVNAAVIPIVTAERVNYFIGSTVTSYSEMMGLPDGQLDNTYWFPWYKNDSQINTQLRIGNVSGATAHVHVYIAGTEMTGSPYTLTTTGDTQSTRLSYVANGGPVKIVSDQNIVATERVNYFIGGAVTSYSEMMGLPASQLDTTYWFPWYKNDSQINTQLRIGNVSGSDAHVHVYIAGAEMTGSPYTLTTTGDTQSVRLSYTANAGPVKIVSDQNIVAAERVNYFVGGAVTSYAEMMGLPNSQLDKTYWFPWYKNDSQINTQLRIGNVSGSDAHVHVYIGTSEMAGSPYTLTTTGDTQSVRLSYTANDGPVKIISDQNIVAAERVNYFVGSRVESYAEMMGLPDLQLDTTYWFPWYKNDSQINTQLRIGVP